MKIIRTHLLIAISIFLTTGLIAFSSNQNTSDDRFITFTFDNKSQDFGLYWKNDNGEIIKSFENLKSHIENKQKRLLFAMNAGMFKKDFSPQGLFIQNQKTISPIDTSSGYGNFYLMPNGIFYVTIDSIARICKSRDFKDKSEIKYATQSGPMLVIDGQIHSAFNKGSANLNIRNGVGILPDNKIIFVMSKKKINFYDFAVYFKSMGCENALYLDGFVSRTYLPEKNWIQTGGNFGVIIGVTESIE